MIALAAGGFHSLALMSDGTVVGWGGNSNGQATPPAGLTGVAALAAGDLHSLALKSDGTVVGWGENVNGQAVPPAGLTGVVALAAERIHSLALKSDGTLVGWGTGAVTGALSYPTGLSGVTAISTGIAHGTALKSDRTVVAWGRAPGGKDSVPRGLAEVTAISSGGDHNLAITTLTSSLTVGTAGSGSGTITPSSAIYPRGTPLTFNAMRAQGSSFAGWRIDGMIAGTLNPVLELPMDRDHTVVAIFSNTPPPTFTDVSSGGPAASAIAILTTQGVIKGYGDGTFGPDDPTLRAQMAAMIARAMGWDAEDHGNHFPDQCDPPGLFDPAKNCVDPDLWRNVGTMQFYAVAKGFQDGTYAPRNNVLHAQAISFITRAMVEKGYWQYQDDDATYYPDVTDADHRRDIATYVYYAGALPQTDEPTDNWPVWATPSTRGWFALALVEAVNSAFLP